MPELRLSFMGTPQITYQGTNCKLRPRKAVALVAYLAVTGQPQSRDTLSALLWPETDHGQSRANLRNLLWILTKTLGEERFRVERETVALVPNETYWLDVEQFRSLLSATQTHDHAPGTSCQTCFVALAEAAALYRDDFLAGFTLADSPAFDEWQSYQAEELRHLFGDVLTKLIDFHRAQGDWTEAILYLKRWLVLDPLQEAAHAQLMELYAWTGQRSAALRQYQTCMRLLETELGVPPLAETTTLHKQILEGEIGEHTMPFAAAPHPEPPLQPPSRTVEHPLVGRVAEWQILLNNYASTGQDGRLLIIEGEAGIGKTRLAEEFLAHAHELGATVLRVRCYEGEMGLAYSPFAEVMETALGQSNHRAQLQGLPSHVLSEAARLVPGLSTLCPQGVAGLSIDPATAQRRLVESIVQILTVLCEGERPGIIFIDDLHWADSASLDLVTYLVRRLTGRPLCLLVTWRAEQVPSAHRLRHLVADTSRTGQATLLSLTRLDQQAVSELVTKMTGDTMTLSARLFEETEGLPFFLIEYLTAITDQAIAPDHERWVMPRGARALLQTRLATVSEASRSLLMAAAAVGRPAEFDLLYATSGLSEEQSITALDELLAQLLMIEREEGSGTVVYTFGHEKLRTFVYQEMSVARRRRLHQRVAEVLSVGKSGNSAGALASQIAHHYRLAGQNERAAEHYRQAGEHARTLYAHSEALNHFQAALELGHGDNAALHEMIGELQTLLGRYPEAIASYSAAMKLYAPEEQARVAHKLGKVYGRRGEWLRAEEQFTAASAALPASHVAALYADWSLVARQLGERARARTLAAKALESAKLAGESWALAQAHNILGVLARGDGNLTEARHHFEQSLALVEERKDPAAQIAVLNNLALLYGASGEVERALDLARAALNRCVLLGDKHHEAALHNNIADLLHASGQLEDAMYHLKQSAQIYAMIGREAEGWLPEIWKLAEW